MLMLLLMMVLLSLDRPGPHLAILSYCTILSALETDTGLELAQRGKWRRLLLLGCVASTWHPEHCG